MINKNITNGGLYMALIKCPECGAEMSDRAVSCPKCGYQDKAENMAICICAIVFSVIFPVIGFILGIVTLFIGNRAYGRIAIIISIVLMVICFYFIYFLL